MAYYKKIYDPLHGFIRLSSAEKDLIDSFAFQRLHSIHQLGVAYLVYPGASHTRFEHSLGVMEVATEIFDRLVEKGDFFTDDAEIQYWRQIVRFAALCHDLGHLPFSHVGEKRLLGEEGHEKWTLALIESSFLRPIWDSLQKEHPSRSVMEDIIKTSIGKQKLRQWGGKWEQVAFAPLEFVMSQIITGDFFGADRIDYLLRDARCTGVSYGLFDYHQLIEMLCILPCEMEGEESLTLGIEENGIESCEALLLARHFMHKRVYQYPSVKAYSFHMARFMEKLYAKTHALSSLNRYLSYTDHEVLTELRAALLDPSHAGHEDALSLHVREHRCLAMQMPSYLKLEEIEEWKTRYQLEDGVLDWSFIEHRLVDSEASFPVLLKNRTIMDAKMCMEIQIPSAVSSWIYVSPKYADSIQKAIESSGYQPLSSIKE